MNPEPQTKSSAAAQVRRSFPLTNFYDTPNPLPAGKAGELIRTEDINEYDLPDAVSAKRILYHSRAANGGDVATSGVVLFPEGKPPTDGWPIIAWAHDLSGVARTCAPSLERNLEHGPFLAMYVGLGYAVVATDYTGLGTSFRNAAFDVPSNAADVINSVAAARAAVPQLSAKWLAMGYGEGGAAALGVSETDIASNSNFLGSVVIAGVTSSPPAESSPLFFAYGIKTVFPDFPEKEILTDAALALYPQVEKSCANPRRPSAELVKPGWQENPTVKKYVERSVPGQKATHGPILLIASEPDPVFPDRDAEQVVARICRQRTRVEFAKFADPDPGNIIGDSVRDQMAWIQGRFAGRTAPSNCNEHR